MNCATDAEPFVSALRECFYAAHTSEKPNKRTTEQPWRPVGYPCSYPQPATAPVTLGAWRKGIDATLSQSCRAGFQVRQPVHLTSEDNDNGLQILQPRPPMDTGEISGRLRFMQG